MSYSLKTAFASWKNVANHTRLRQITRSMPTSNKQATCTLELHLCATTKYVSSNWSWLRVQYIQSNACWMGNKDQDSQRSTCFRKFDQCCSQCEICPGSYLGYASGKRDQILTKTGERRALCFLVGVHHQQSGTEGYSIDGIGGKMLYNAVCLLIVYDIYIYIYVYMFCFWWKHIQYCIYI